MHPPRSPARPGRAAVRVPRSSARHTHAHTQHGRNQVAAASSDTPLRNASSKARGRGEKDYVWAVSAAPRPRLACLARVRSPSTPERALLAEGRPAGTEAAPPAPRATDGGNKDARHGASGGTGSICGTGSECGTVEIALRI